ncbi:MAG: alpha/beta hydrolase [Gemmatimonadales bacterium]
MRRKDRAAIRLMRLRFAVLSKIAPDAAERAAANLFLTPRPARLKQRSPKKSPRQIVVLHDGLPIAGYSWGEGPAVLLVHGWSGRAMDMAPLAEQVADAGYRAVAFDMPAHGATPGKRSSLGEWVSVLPRLADECGELHAIVGHSLGAGAVVLALEAGLQAKGAILFAPPLGPGYFIYRLQQFIGLPEERAAGMERRLVDKVGREMAYFDSARAVSSLEMPALIVHDPADREVPWEHAEAINRNWRGSLLIEATGLGHVRILRSHEVLEQAVSFVKGLDQSTEKPLVDGWRSTYQSLDWRP